MGMSHDPINDIDPDGLSGASISAIKAALKKVHARVGKLPKGEPGKWGSPQHGTPKKGYRLDPPHPNKPPCDPEAGAHINWWDYTNGKKIPGVKGAEPIILGSFGAIYMLFDAYLTEQEARKNNVGIWTQAIINMGYPVLVIQNGKIRPFNGAADAELPSS